MGNIESMRQRAEEAYFLNEVLWRLYASSGPRHADSVHESAGTRWARRLIWEAFNERAGYAKARYEPPRLLDLESPAPRYNISPGVVAVDRVRFFAYEELGEVVTSHADLARVEFV